MTTYRPEIPLDLQSIEKLCSIGRKWERYGKRRVYLDSDKVLALCSVEIGYYGTGNIRYCRVSDEGVSNAEGGRWLASAIKLCYDLDEDAFLGEGKHFEDLVNAALAYVHGGDQA